MDVDEENPTVQDLLGDAMFNGKLKQIIIVGLDDDDQMIVWHTRERAMWFVGLLEAAQQQLLGIECAGVGPDEDDDDPE